MTIENKSIQHVLALAKHRHFARAAESLSLSQPALSRSISVLEQRLGVQLFDRTPGGVEPTAYGRLIIERGKEISLKENELLRELQLMQGVEIGELSIGAGPFPFEISVGQAVSGLLLAFPKLRLQVEAASPAAIVNRVLEGKCDIGVADIRDWHDDHRLRIEMLPMHVGVFCCRPEHPLAAKKTLSQDDVLAYPLIGTIFPPQFADVFESHETAGNLDEISRHFSPAVTIHSLDLARKTTIACDLIFPVAIVAIEAQLHAGELVVLDCHPAWLRTNYGFISKRDRTPSPAAIKFMDFFRDIEAKLMEKEDALLAEFVNSYSAGTQSNKLDIAQ
jgi:DNA-binding transcriptional LysR family regulator